MEETYSLSNALKERLAKAATEGEPMNMIKTMEHGIEIKLDNFEIGTGLPYAKVVEEGIPLEKIAKAALEAKPVVKKESPVAKPSTDVKKADDKKTPAKKEEKKAAKKDAAKKEDAKKAETKKAEDKKKEADKKAEDTKKEADKKAEEAKKAAEKAEKK